MANPKLVSLDDPGAHSSSNKITGDTENANLTLSQTEGSSTVSKTETISGSLIWEALGATDLPNEVKGIIYDSWRSKTKSRYKGVLKRWRQHCIQRNENPYIADVRSVLIFLHGMYKNGCLYSGICAARSALSSVVQVEGCEKLSSHPLITRFVKGIFNRHPPLPKYSSIWDINTLLTYYENMPHNNELDFKFLCKKLVVLFLILGARRKQALTTIIKDNVILEHDKVILLPNKTLKHSTPNCPLKPFIYRSYRQNEKLCIVNCMKFYLDERNCKVDDNNKNLIITYGKPHKNASEDTISRWVKDELKNAGIDTKVYTAHSCRAASSSKAKQVGMSVTEILKRGCWSTNSTFQKFYNKDIIANNIEDGNYETAIIESDNIKGSDH